MEHADYPAARELFFEMLPTLELMEGGGKYTQWVKAACELVGQPVGAPRAPLRAATVDDVRRLQAALAACSKSRE